MNLFDAYEVENAQKGEHIIVLDPGAHMSLAERPGLNKHLAKYDNTVEDMVTSSCFQVFLFRGIHKRHKSKLMLELPLVVRSTKEKDHVLKAQCYVIAEDMTFSVENITIENWVSILDTRNSLLKTSITGDEKISE